MTPIVYRTQHRIAFSDLDPYDHVSTAHYARYYIDHRMAGLRDVTGWDLKTLATLPFLLWVRRLEIEFLRPVRGDTEITITSAVREFRGADAIMEATMLDRAETVMSRCTMTVAHVDRETRRATPWPPGVMALFYEPALTSCDRAALPCAGVTPQKCG